MDTNVVASVLLSAFIIDRLIAALMFVASYARLPASTDEPTRAQRSEYGRKFQYFVLSAALSAIALRFIPYGSITLGGISNPAAKAFVMWLILVAGADRISEFIGKSAAPALATPKNEFRVTGTMTLKESGEKSA